MTRPRCLEDDPVIIARLGWEGGGVDILGASVNGRWQFWRQGSSMAMDENDLDEWRTWTSAPTEDLHAVVPDDWPLMLPIQVHLDFAEWFRSRYKEARERFPSQPRSTDERWQRALDNDHTRRSH